MEVLYTFRKTASNSTVEFGPKRDWTPIFSLLGPRLTTPPELRRSTDRANSDRPSALRSSGGVVKRGPRRLKIGVQSRFGPNSTVEFEAVFRKNFGVAYYTLSEIVYSRCRFVLTNLFIKVLQNDTLFQ